MADLTQILESPIISRGRRLSPKGLERIPYIASSLLSGKLDPESQKGLDWLWDKLNPISPEGQYTLQQVADQTPTKLDDALLGVALPVAKYSPKLIEQFKKLLGFNPTDLPVNRFQQEKEAPISRGGRGGLFTSYIRDMTNRHRGYEGTIGGEGGSKEFIFEHQPKQILPFLHDGEYFGPTGMRVLLGEKESSRIDNELGAILSHDIQSNKDYKKHVPALVRKYLSPKQVITAKQGYAPANALQEAITHSIANKYGYDTLMKIQKGIRGYQPTQVSIIDKKMTPLVNKIERGTTVPKIKYEDILDDELESMDLGNWEATDDIYSKPPPIKSKPKYGPK